MPRTNRPPAYRLHKARNCAVLTIQGKNHYLGPYGSPESHEAYARLIAKWRAVLDSPTRAPVREQSTELTVNAVILKYLDFSAVYYRKHDRPTGEINNIRAALAALKKLYGRSLAQAFGPKDLELVRSSIIDASLARKTINGRISRIKRMFRWASKEGLVPAITYHGLLALDGLKFNRSRARETKRVTPVADEHVSQTLVHLNEHARPTPAEASERYNLRRHLLTRICLLGFRHGLF